MAARAFWACLDPNSQLVLLDGWRRSGVGGRRERTQNGPKTQVPDGKRAAVDAPFSMETAASGRASCRQCGEAIAKGARKASVSAWARGGRIQANHHLSCFAASLRVEVCPSSRGKCKHCSHKLVKGEARIGYATTGADEVAWLCLESSSSLLPPLLTEVEHWTPEQALKGYEALPCELQAEVKRSLRR